MINRMPIRRILGAAAFAAAAMAAAPAIAQAPDNLVPHADYANNALWLCKPGIANDKCKVNLDATIVTTQGNLVPEKFKAASNAPIDCFFVYPTVSLDPGYLSDWTPDKMEFEDVKVQFARFGSVCRTFAPLYRQFTLTALRARTSGVAPAGAQPPQGLGGYADVVDAWNYYMQHDNNGRGVVLIGHSQGAGLITRLVAGEIEGKPVQKQLVSAIILGSSVMVPPGADVGGSFKSVPLCRSETQLGCAINYVTFRNTNPPPPESNFGKSRDGMVAGCTNPANLATGKGWPESYFMTSGFLNGSGGETPPWTTAKKKIPTDFVKTPGLIATECTSSGDFSYLAMTVEADPSDKRTDKVAGEIQRATGTDWSWGLHLIDVDHSMGDLVRIVRKQGEAYAKPH